MNGNLSKIDQTIGKLTYTPDSGYTGKDSFVFKVNDGKFNNNLVGIVNINIQ